MEEELAIKIGITLFHQPVNTQVVSTLAPTTHERPPWFERVLGRESV